MKYQKPKHILGTLTDIQINNLLTRNALGRIGYYDAKKSYITPVTYVFDGVHIIGQTNEGLKLKIMRNNPSVCFEVGRDEQHVKLGECNCLGYL